MQISKKLATEIVNNLKDVINQDINLMNDKGIIIASTDAKRVNTFHEASKKCVDENKTIYIKYDNEYKGSKKGINIPVEFNRQVIGVIGISGQEEVKKYGTIIKKMTEILLREEWIKENQALEIENNRNLIDNLIHDNIKKLDYIPDNLIKSSKYIGYTLINKKTLTSFTRDSILKYINLKFQHSNTYLSFFHNELIMLFLHDDKSKLLEIVTTIIKIFKLKFNLKIRIGLSQSFKSINSPSIFYNQAQRCYKWINYKEDDLGFFDEIGLGKLITAIDDRELYEYSYLILRNIEDNKLDYYKKLVYLYGKYNGSISKIAKVLYMHKNSVQYNLNKLKILTGYDPRNINDYMVLWLAFLSLK